MEKKKLSIIFTLVLLISSCATQITGSVKLVDRNQRPLADQDHEGIVVNMINTSAELENASVSVTTDKQGLFSTKNEKLKPGVYKIEVTHIGFQTATMEVKVSGGKKVDMVLMKIPEGRRRSIRIRKNDADKIINPGEVNIQPPSM